MQAMMPAIFFELFVGAGSSACGARPRPIQMQETKIRQAMTRWVASRYWLTSVRSARPDDTIHQPMKP